MSEWPPEALLQEWSASVAQELAECASLDLWQTMSGNVLIYC